MTDAITIPDDGPDPRDATMGRPFPLGPIAAPEQTVEPLTPRERLGAIVRPNIPFAYTAQQILRGLPSEAPEDGYSAWPKIKGTRFQQYADQFMGDVNPAQSEARMAKIDQIEQDRANAARTGAPGMAMGLLAGLLNPAYWFLPELKGAALGAAAFGGSEVANQAMRHLDDPTATWRESAMAVGEGAILGGILGKGMAWLSPEEQARAAAELAAVRRPTATAPAAGAESLSAAEADPRTMKLAKIGVGDLGFDIPKWLLMASPTGREFVDSLRSAAGKKAMGDLAETSLKFEEAGQGITSFTGEGPVDALIRQHHDPMILATRDAMHSNFAEYQGRAGDAWAREKDFLRQLTGRTDGRMSYEEFGREVSKALYSGDVHPVPEVEAAAKAIRRDVFGVGEKLAQETRGTDGKVLLEEDHAPPKGDKSFFARLYDQAAILANPNGFDQKTFSWLKREQAEKRSIQQRLGAMKENMDRVVAAGRTDLADAIRKEIEQQIVSWEGKTTREAKQAILARMKAEAQRELDAVAKDKVGATGRLTAADKAVDSAVEKILKSDRNLDDEALLSRAREIRNRILNLPDGRLPYDTATGASEQYGAPANPLRGSLHAREFAIPTADIAEFTIHDPEMVVGAYLRTLLPQVFLTRKFGDVEMTNVFKQVNEHYDALLAKTTSAREIDKLNKARRKEIIDLAGVRDRIRGIYGLPTTAFHKNWGRWATAIANANVITKLGTAMINSANDLANATSRRGLLGFFGDSFIPFVKALAGSEIEKAERDVIRHMAIGAETRLGHLISMYGEVNQTYRMGNKFERGLKIGAEQSMIWTGLGPWTDAMKQMHAMGAMRSFLRTAEKIAKGTASEKDLRLMAEAGISPQMAERIHTNFENGGHSVVNGAKIANPGEWSDQGAARAFDMAIRRDANIAVSTPGQEKSLWLSDPVLGVLGQFKSYSVAAHERILLSNLQNMDGRTLEWFAHMSSLAALSYAGYCLVSGNPMSTNPMDWAKEIAKRASFFGWMSDVNDITAKATAGLLDPWRLVGAGKPLTRHQTQGTLAELLGPAGGNIESALGIVGDTTTGAFSERTLHHLRQTVIPMQNHWAFRRVLDEAEDNISRHYGLKMMNRHPQTYQ